MAHLYKMSEWQSPTGDWHCNDVEELGKGSGYWWLPARMMQLTPAAYLQWVIENFRPDKINHSEDCSYVGWTWKSQVKMRKFKNHINALARRYNFIVC